MPNLLVRDLDVEILERLKARARAHHRSLQGEAKAVLEQAASVMTMAQFRQELSAWQAHWGDRTFPDSTADIRADRER